MRVVVLDGGTPLPRWSETEHGSLNKHDIIGLIHAIATNKKRRAVSKARDQHLSPPAEDV